MLYLKKIFLPLILASLLLCCSDKNKKENNFKVPVLEKTAIELEDESIKEDKSWDTITSDFVLGMTKKQVIEHCKELLADTLIGNLTDGNFYYAIETKSFKIPLRLDFYYDNEERLFRIQEKVILNLLEKKKGSNSNAILKNELLQNYKNAFGKTPLTNGTQPNAKYYWLSGDKRFDYVELQNNYILASTKISLERKQIAFINELDRKIQEEKIKKQEEEILQKTMLDNLQIQEEESIITKLKAKAKRDWPEDYTTQEYWINEEIEAYHYMLRIPNNNKIKKKAQRDWPLDFSTQKYWYNEQIEAKERLE